MPVGKRFASCSCRLLYKKNFICSLRLLCLKVCSKITPSCCHLTCSCLIVVPVRHSCHYGAVSQTDILRILIHLRMIILHITARSGTMTWCSLGLNQFISRPQCNIIVNTTFWTRSCALWRWPLRLPRPKDAKDFDSFWEGEITEKSGAMTWL